MTKSVTTPTPTVAEMIYHIKYQIGGAERGLFEVLPEHLPILYAIRDRLAFLTDSTVPRTPAADTGECFLAKDSTQALHQTTAASKGAASPAAEVTPQVDTHAKDAEELAKKLWSAGDWLPGKEDRINFIYILQSALTAAEQPAPDDADGLENGITDENIVQMLRDANPSVDWTGENGLMKKAASLIERLRAAHQKPDDSYADLCRAVQIYQERTGQTLEDTLAGKWTNPKPEDWHDISTAPKDGTTFDVWNVANGRWTNIYYENGDFYRHIVCEDHTEEILFDMNKWCTHWMPLPQPPKDNKP